MSSLPRSARSLGCLAIAAVLLPGGLAGCSQTLAAGDSASVELRAASGSEMLTVPETRDYEVTGFAVANPEALRGGAGSSARGEGYLVLSDRVITEAQLTARFTNGETISFTLSEPLVLRREPGSNDAVTAVGTLAVPGAEWHGTRARVSPHFTEGGSATLDVEIAVPDSLLAQGTGGDGAGTVTATITLDER